MDRVLEKSEKKELIKLLGIPAHSFGNIAVMKSAYKKVSKKYHPDKGGSGEVMMSLNSLWQKFQEGCLEIRHEEVGCWWFDDPDGTLYAYCGSIEAFENNFLRSPACIARGRSRCHCITSLLSTQHFVLKLQYKKPCLVWGECFCYFCFCLWFGLEWRHWQNFEWWKRSLADIPVKLLHLVPQSNHILRVMDQDSSESNMQNGAGHFSMKDLQSNQTYIVMSPVPLPRMKQVPKVQVTIPTPSLPPPIPPKTRVPHSPVLTPLLDEEEDLEDLPPPLPPKKRMYQTPRPVPKGTLEIEIQCLQEELEELRRNLKTREEETLQTWMDLIRARKLAIKARRQRIKERILTGLLIFLLLCMIMFLTLYFLIRQ
ncbi:middle T antigen [Tupaia glis polyomavirus 1]|uniref:Middle T antigen n=1 Tax=Tupaia glis polyomavirus 1 TaxID=2170402 RepID=A0A2S1CJR6_9POLY|nr:middle T antigen [Tupaia glis polyomavirus 1]AWD33804.1 middle T antigen [Tupaia glis polyomavirus 1]